MRIRFRSLTIALFIVAMTLPLFAQVQTEVPPPVAGAKPAQAVILWPRQMVSRRGSAAVVARLLLAQGWPPDLGR